MRTSAQSHRAADTQVLLLAGSSREGTVAGSSQVERCTSSQPLDLEALAAMPCTADPISYTTGLWCPSCHSLVPRSPWCQRPFPCALLPGTARPAVPALLSTGPPGGLCPAGPGHSSLPRSAGRVTAPGQVPQGTVGTLCRARGASSSLSPPGRLGYTALAILKNSSAASSAIRRSCQTTGWEMPF